MQMYGKNRLEKHFSLKKWKLSMKSDEASRLRVFRKQFIGSQEDMSEVVGGTQSSISDAERGKVRISTPMLRILMEVYRLNPFWLFFGKPPMQISEAHLAYLKSTDTEGDSIYYLLTEALGPLSLKSSNMVIPIDLHADYVEAARTKKWDVEKLHAIKVVQFPGMSGMVRTFQQQSNHMAPTFQNGDFLCCTPLKNIKDALGHSLCVVVTRSYGILAARVQQVEEEEKKISLTFDGATGSQRTLPFKEILEAWEVRSKVSSNF